MGVISGGNVIGYPADSLGQARIYKVSGTPVDGGSGTYVNVIQTGDIVIDTDDGIAYINTGTSALPVYVTVGSQT